MPNPHLSARFGLLLCLSILVAWAPGASAAALDELQGKWITRKTNDDGRPYSQSLTFSDTKVRFEILDDSQKTVLIAKGTIKAERQGSFQVLSMTGISAGRSEAELEPVDRDATSVYLMHGETLYVAANLDRVRENQPPRLEAYKRGGPAGAAAASAPAAPDLSGTWKMVLTLNEQDLEYELKLQRDGQKYLGTLISPRSGPHDMKLVDFTNGKLRMVIDRKVNDTDATFTYEGKLEGADKLGGQLRVRSGDNELTGTWKAEK